MSMHPHPLPPVPDETARVARAACHRGNPYLLLRDNLGPIFHDRDFLSIYGNAGHPATSPALLALVTLLQFMEHLTDEQTADAVRTRVDWKYLLGLPLEDDGFDPSVLSEFRTRLVEGSQEDLLLDRLVVVLKEQGLLRAGGRQRTDSTHVVMAVRALNQLELVGETMRSALNTLAVEAPEWIVAHSEPAWAERYGPRIAAARLPKAAAKRDQLARQIGQDGLSLLTTLDAPETPGQLRELAAIRTLRQVWAQQYNQGRGGPRLRSGKELPPAAELIRTPYDPEARWSVKRQMEWTGYTKHLTETCDDDLPHLLTSADTEIATTPDCAAIKGIQARLAQREMLPGEQLIDAGYITAPVLVTSQQTHGITVIGPVRPDSSWQGRAAAGFAAGDFQLDWEASQAICPQGKTSSTWRPVTGGGGHPAIQIHFRQADCVPCPVKAQCTRADRRSLTIQPRAEQEALMQARSRQASPTFKATYAVRAGIEGTISQAVRRTGARTARYRGRAKTHLQHVFTAAALDLVRVAAWFRGDEPVTTRHSAYATLMAHAT
jgi:transposase